MNSPREGASEDSPRPNKRLLLTGATHRQQKRSRSAARSRRRCASRARSSAHARNLARARVERAAGGARGVLTDLSPPDLLSSCTRWSRSSVRTPKNSWSNCTTRFWGLRLHHRIPAALLTSDVDGSGRSSTIGRLRSAAMRQLEPPLHSPKENANTRSQPRFLMSSLDMPLVSLR